MPKRSNLKCFEEFTGVDFTLSDLTRPPASLLAAQNYHYAQGGALIGRRGFQVIGQRGYFKGGHVYTYLDSDSGATVEEVLAHNDNLFRLTQSIFTITYTGAGNWFYEVAFRSPNWYFDLFDSGTNPLTVNLGTGTEAQPVTIWDLIPQIEAVPNFNCSVPTKHAKVNGDQSSATTITVDAGHDLFAGDYVSFINHGDPSYVDDYGYGVDNTGSPRLTARIITATTATTISFADMGTVWVKDNQDIGASAAPAAGIVVTEGIALDALPFPPQPGAHPSLSTPYSVYWPYWEPILFNRLSGSAAVAPLYHHLASGSPYPASFVSANDVCYIGVPRVSVGLGIQADLDPDGKLLKYDGQHVYRAGVPQATIASATPSAGSDTYQYIATIEQTDQRGNIVEGVASAITTVSAGALPVSVVLNNLRASNSQEVWFNTPCAVINGNQSGAGTQTGLTVDSGHTLRIGDIVSIYDNTTNSIVRRTITAATSTTLTWASTTAINVTDNHAVSCGLIHKLWRTKKGGIEFYLVAQRPNDSTLATQTISDNAADTSLSIQYEWPENEHNLPPSMHFLCLHQGCLCGAGDRGNPNTVSFSSPGDLEYFPTATNSIDIPSTVRGAITAIGSDADERLAVFKANAYYHIEGDFGTASIVPHAKNEGDYGVISHSSLIKVNSRLVGISLLGPVEIVNGELSPRAGRPIRPMFTQNPAVGNLIAAMCANDPRNLLYRCWVNENDFAANVLGFAADYEEGLQWFSWDYATLVRPQYGILVSTDNLYNLGKYQAFREMNYAAIQPNSQIERHFHDNGTAIQYDLAWIIQRDEPSIEKYPLWLKLYSLDSELEDDYVTFSTTIKTYRNRGTAASTSTTKTFLGGEENYEQAIKLASSKSRILKIALQTKTIGERPFYNGWELIMVEPTDDKDFAE